MSDVYTEFRPATGMDRASLDSQGYGMVQYGPGDDKLLVGFYRRSIQNKAISQREGKPIYESRDYIKIQHPGESLNVVDREATPQDKARFRNHWARYQEGVQQTPAGIPLSLLFPVKPEIESMLRQYNIHTVEQLAGLSAHGIGTVGMGCQEWVNAAQRYMEHANKGVNHHQHQKEVADLNSKIATLSRQVEELSRIANQRIAAPIDMQTHDFQSEQIANAHASSDPSQSVLQKPVHFTQDLSGEVQPSKPRGRPAGSKNKPKE